MECSHTGTWFLIVNAGYLIVIVVVPVDALSDLLVVAHLRVVYHGHVILEFVAPPATPDLLIRLDKVLGLKLLLVLLGAGKDGG